MPVCDSSVRQPVKAKKQNWFQSANFKAKCAFLLFITLAILWWQYQSTNYLFSQIKPLRQTGNAISKLLTVAMSEITTTQNKTTREQKMITKAVGRPLNDMTGSPGDIQRFLQTASTTMMFPTAKPIYLETLLRFDHIWRKTLNLTYFLYGGTMIGVVRHQGFIPWDDNVDLMVNEADRVHLETVFKNTDLEIRKQGPMKRKIFLKKLKPGMIRTRYGLNWPFLDIFLYRFENSGTVLCDSSTWNFRINSTLVFPLRFLPFEGHKFPAPRCPYKFVKQANGPNVMRDCCPSRYNHRWERNVVYAKCVPCVIVKKFFQNFLWIPLEPDPKSCAM